VAIIARTMADVARRDINKKGYGGTG
jgi:hypothetical protein